MPRYISGNFKKTPSAGLTSDRYRYLSPGDAEPNLGDPKFPGDSPPVGTQYQIVSIEGYPGSRYWVPVGGGIIPGSITVYDENNVVGGPSSTTQLNFVGAAVSAIGTRTGLSNPGIAVTIRISPPGNDGELLFKSSGDFSTSSKLTFNTSNGLLTAGDLLNVGAGGTVITTNNLGYVGLGTINPTQELHVQGDIRLTGTIYDYNNSGGTNGYILAKNTLGGISWTDPSSVRSGAGGSYQSVQFKNNVGLVDGAANFVYNEITQRVGIGSTIPTVLLDVIGSSKFTGQTEIDRLNVTGVSTIATLGVSGSTTTRNLLVTGVTTLGVITATSAWFTGIVTASKFIGDVDMTNLSVSGIATIGTLGVTGTTTTRDFTAYQSTNLNRLKATGISTFDGQVVINNLNVTGVSTFDNLKLDTNTIFTTVGNLVLDSTGGTVQIDDALYVNSTLDSSSKDTGSVITEGGVGIEKNLYVGGTANLATQGGITTTGGDLYIGNNLIVRGSSQYNQISASIGTFTEYLETKNFKATGISTVNTLNVDGPLNANSSLNVTGVVTFTNNVFLGDTSSDTVYYRSLVGTGITPSADNTHQLGSATNKWKDIYATTFNGSFLGNADTASRLQTPREIDISGDVIGVGIGTTFDGSRNVVIPTTLSTTGVNAGTYGSGTQVGQFTVDAKGRITSASNVDISFNVANAATAERVGIGSTTGSGPYPLVFVDSNNTSRSYEYLYTDESLSFDPVTNQLYVGFIKFGRIYDVTDSPGLQNEVPTADGNGGWLWKPISGVPASQVATGTTTGTNPYYLTFVTNNNGARANENFYTDANITYNPSTDLLTVSKLNVNQVGSGLTPNGSFNLGSTANKWSTLYVDNIEAGNINISSTLTGAASSITVTSDTANATRYFVFSGSNVTGGISSVFVDSNITYNPSTDILTVPNINVSNQVRSSLVPNTNGTLDLGSASNKWNNIYANTINANVTGTLTGSASSITVFNDSNNSTRYPMFSSTNTNAGVTSAYVDNDITYNASTNVLSVNKLKPTQILDTSSGTGSPNQILTADGSGGWTWANASSVGVGTTTVRTTSYTVTSGSSGSVGHTTAYGTTQVVLEHTPRSSTSFMLISGSIPTTVYANGSTNICGINYQLRRTVGLTTTVLGTYPVIYNPGSTISNNSYYNTMATFTIWDEPNTTSTVKYEIFGRGISTTGYVRSSSVGGVSENLTGFPSPGMFGGFPNSFEVNNTAKSNLTLIEFVR